MATQVDSATPQVFTRKSSGLVREVSTLDTMFFGVMAIAVGYYVFIINAWSSYPGASMVWATVLTLIPALALCIVYGLLSSVYPRSGGEYVFVSRVAHPALGFGVSFAVTVWQAIYLGIDGAFLALYGIGPLFETLGAQEHSHGLTSIGTFFTGKGGVFLLGAVMVVGVSLMTYRGMRFYFRVMRTVGWISLLCVAVTLVVLALVAAGAINFRAHYNAFAGSGAYGALMTSASKAGVALHPAGSFSETLKYAIWPAYATIFAVLSASFSGEVKNVRRGQLFGMNAAVVLGTLILVAMMAVAEGAVGGPFLHAIQSADPSTLPAGVSPYVSTLASIAGGNVVLTVICNLWVVLFIPMAAATAPLYASRAMLAWSIDGAAPRWLGDVSRRYHSPTWSVLVCGIVGMVFLALYAFTTLIATLSGLLGFGIAFVVTAATGAAFPYVRKAVYKASPAAATWLGVPVIMIAGVIAVASMIFLMVRAAVDTVFGANTTFSIVMSAAVFVVGCLAYFVASAVQRRRGVDIALRFKEIPVE